jgi:hypothetical protein
MEKVSNTKVCVVHSRGLRDRALKYADMIRDDGYLVCILSKAVKVKDENGNFLTETEIFEQKMETIKGCDELHVLYDGNDKEVPMILGGAHVLKKGILMVMSNIDTVFRFFREKRRVPRPGEKNKKKKGNDAKV